MICFEFLLNEFITNPEFEFMPNSQLSVTRNVLLVWQIALQLVRQGETIDATIRSAQSIEPLKDKVDSDELGVVTVQKENSESVEGSNTEKVGETCDEVDMVQTGLSSEQSHGLEVV